MFYVLYFILVAFSIERIYNKNTIFQDRLSAIQLLLIPFKEKYRKKDKNP